MAADGHQVNIRDPYVYRTRNYGRSLDKDHGWNSVQHAQLYKGHRENPIRPGLLYLGPENALYVSFDDGDHWQPFQNNLPQAPVSGMVIQEHFNDLVVGTYGRGFWILDDIAPSSSLRRR